MSYTISMSTPIEKIPAKEEYPAFSLRTSEEMRKLKIKIEEIEDFLSSSIDIGKLRIEKLGYEKIKPRARLGARVSILNFKSIIETMRKYSLEIKREISVDELAKYLDMDEASIKEELKSLLRSYEIPEEFVGRVETMIRNYIKSELEKRGLPVEDWIINPLYKLFVHIAHAILYV